MIGVDLQMSMVVRRTTVGSTRAEQAMASQIYSRSSSKRVVELPVRDIPNAVLASPLLFQSGKMAGLGKVCGRWGPRFQSFKGNPGMIQMDFWCKNGEKKKSLGRRIPSIVPPAEPNR